MAKWNDKVYAKVQAAPLMQRRQSIITVDQMPGYALYCFMKKECVLQAERKCKTRPTQNITF